jgi:uncharacterized protein (TIGR03118 family)
VFNIALGAGAFPVSNGTRSAPAVFLFATEDGTIVGWNPGINPAGSDPAKAGTFGTIAVDNSANPTAADGAVYKGLAIATGPTGPIVASDPNSGTLLYAANFRSGHIDVFETKDTKFAAVTLPKGAFTDPDLPKGYAPFNVQELGGKIYVTYAKQDKDKHDDVAGHGHGFVDVYNLDGSGEQRLVTRGKLDSPWGLALAPPSFGPLAGALLVGNFGDGRIHAYNAKGDLLDTLKDPDGEPIAIDGLWALKVGNGGNGGDTDKVYFTAGLFGETHGLFGSLASVAPGSPEGQAEEQMVQAELDVFEANASTVLHDLSAGVPKDQLKQDVKALNASFEQLVRGEVHLIVDELRDGDVAAALAHARELEAVEDVFEEIGRLLHDHG